MKIQDVMTRDIATCAPDSDLASVAMLMLNEDCGSVPVTDDSGRPIGMITDRDISIAGATQQRPLSDIRVSDVKGDRVIACEQTQDVKEALKLMMSTKVRRLAVVDTNGKLSGLLSMGDIVAEVPVNGGGDPASEDVISALKSVYVHH